MKHVLAFLMFSWGPNNWKRLWYWLKTCIIENLFGVYWVLWWRVPWYVCMANHLRYYSIFVDWWLALITWWVLVLVRLHVVDVIAFHANWQDTSRAASIQICSYLRAASTMLGECLRWLEVSNLSSIYVCNLVFMKWQVKVVLKIIEEVKWSNTFLLQNWFSIEY